MSASLPLASECTLQSSLRLSLLDQVRMNLWEHVRKQMQPFLEGKSGDALPADCPVGSKLKLGLTVLFMMEAVDFVVSKNDLVWLCYLLTPSAGSLDALLSDLSPIVSKPQKYFLFLLLYFLSHVCGCCTCMCAWLHVEARRSRISCSWRVTEGCEPHVGTGN